MSNLNLTAEQEAQLNQLAEQHLAIVNSKTLPNQITFRHLAAYYALRGMTKEAEEALGQSELTDEQIADPAFWR